MAVQWVDITTIDNNTPFSKVRWLQNIDVLDSSGWLEFSEVSGLTIDNSEDWWVAAGAQYGYASTHRCNYFDNTFTCTFLNEYRSGVDVSAPNPVMGEAVHDVARSQYYDNTVELSGQTFYEVDFSTWRGYTPLYYPYSGQAVTAGEVFVYAGISDITGDKEKVSFKSTGGTNSVTITAENDWTASASTNWFTVSALSGTSGTTVVTITAPDYQDTTSARTGTIVFTCNSDTFEVTVKQAKMPSGTFGGLILGSADLENMYFGDNALEGLYLGDLEIFSGSAPTPTPTGETQYYIRYTASRQITPMLSDAQWGAEETLKTFDSTTHIGYIYFDQPFRVPGGMYGFYGKTAMTSVEIVGATAITRSQGSYGAFNGCTGLTSVTIGDSVQSVADATFADCGNIRWVRIGSGIQSLPNLMVPSCSTLSEIFIKATTPPTVASGDDPFRGCASDGVLNCLDESVGYYENWIATIPSISGWTVQNDCFGDPECECTMQGGYIDPVTGECVIVDPCAGDPQCECENQGGTWDDENQECTYGPDPEPIDIDPLDPGGDDPGGDYFED